MINIFDIIYSFQTKMKSQGVFIAKFMLSPIKTYLKVKNNKIKDWNWVIVNLNNGKLN